jgi:hypothetical protein
MREGESGQREKAVFLIQRTGFYTRRQVLYRTIGIMWEAGKKKLPLYKTDGTMYKVGPKKIGPT